MHFKYFLVKNVPDLEKIFAFEKIPWLWKNLFLWKTSLIVEKHFAVETSLINEKSLLVKNLLGCGKASAYRKLPCSWRNLCLWKIFLNIKNYLAVENVLDHRKRLYLWKNCLDQVLWKVESCIQNSWKHLRWKIFQQSLRAFNHKPLLQSTPFRCLLVGLSL